MSLKSSLYYLRKDPEFYNIPQATIAAAAAITHPSTTPFPAALVSVAVPSVDVAAAISLDKLLVTLATLLVMLATLLVTTSSAAPKRASDSSTPLDLQKSLEALIAAVMH